MIFLIVFGILMIAGIILCKIFDNDLGAIGRVVGFCSAICFVPLLIIAFFANMSYINDQTRIRLTNQRAAIVEELNQSDHDILLQGIKDARNFNIELEKEQYKLRNPWIKIFHQYVYNEFTSIEYNE